MGRLMIINKDSMKKGKYKIIVEQMWNLLKI